MATEELAIKSSGDAERLLCAAIESLHLVRFVLSGRERIAEPHDYGLIDGRRRLFFNVCGTTTDVSQCCRRLVVGFATIGANVSQHDCRARQ